MVRIYARERLHLDRCASAYGYSVGDYLRNLLGFATEYPPKPARQAPKKGGRHGH
jgi:hypothetical protein